MEKLRNELNAIIDIAGNINGIHKRVANEVGFTQTYIQNIRRGDVLKDETEHSINVFNQLITAYKKELENYAKTIKVIL